MKTISGIVSYLNIALSITCVIILIILLTRIRKILSEVSIFSDGMNKITSELDQTAQKTEKIRSTADSFKFFASLYLIYLLIKETWQNYRESNITLGKSAARTMIRHTGQLKKIRI